MNKLLLFSFAAATLPLLALTAALHYGLDYPAGAAVFAAALVCALAAAAERELATALACVIIAVSFRFVVLPPALAAVLAAGVAGAAAVIPTARLGVKTLWKLSSFALTGATVFVGVTWSCPDVALLTLAAVLAAAATANRLRPAWFFAPPPTDDSCRRPE